MSSFFQLIQAGVLGSLSVLSLILQPRAWVWEEREEMRNPCSSNGKDLRSLRGRAFWKILCRIWMWYLTQTLWAFFGTVVNEYIRLLPTLGPQLMALILAEVLGVQPCWRNCTGASFESKIHEPLPALSLSPPAPPFVPEAMAAACLLPCFPTVMNSYPLEL